MAVGNGFYLNISTMENQQKHEIADALDAYIKSINDHSKIKITQKKLADKIGITASYITHIKNREFDLKSNSGSVILSDYVLQKVEAFLNGHNWQNRSHKECMEALMEAKLYSKHNIIDGPTGTSKTFSCRYFLKKYPVNTYVVTCASDMTCKQFMVELAKEVGLTKLSQSRYQLRRDIGDKLMREEMAHIIIQEAELLPDSSFAAIKDLYDYKDLFKSVGITLVGAELIDLLDSKCSRTHPKFFPQLMSRFSLHSKLAPANKSEMRRIVKMYNLDADEQTRIVTISSDLRQLNDNIEESLADSSNKMELAS